MGTVLFSSLQNIAESTPDRVALRFGAQSTTYRELLAQVDGAAARLQAAGVARGARVAICLDNSPHYLVLTYACAKLGALAITLDPSSTRHELDHVLRECSPSAVVATDALRDRLAGSYASACLGTTTSGVTVDELCMADGRAAAPARVPEAGDFLVQYTSGSTGLPKGVLQTQRGLVARLESWRATAQLRPGDEHLCTLPFSHGYGMYCVAMQALFSGGGLRLVPPSQATPDLILSLLENENINCHYALPSMWQLLAQRARSRPTDLSHLRIAMVGAAPVSVAVLAEVKRQLNVALHNTYGTSEASMLMANLSGKQPSLDHVSIGQPLAGVEVRVLDDADNDCREGRLVVRTAGLARCYYGREEPVAGGDWYETGDVVRRERDGHYLFLGRLSQFINVGGNKVSPTEVEAAIEAIDGVREVVVASVPDPLTGEVVAAAIVSTRPLTMTEVREACKQKLAAFKVPRIVKFFDDFPKGASGKPLRSAVAASLRAARGL